MTNGNPLYLVQTYYPDGRLASFQYFDEKPLTVRAAAILTDLRKLEVEKRQRKAVDCYVCGKDTLGQSHTSEADGHVRHIACV